MKRQMMKKAPHEVQKKCEELHDAFNELSEKIDDEAIMANVMAAYMAESILSQDNPQEALTQFISVLGNYIKDINDDMSNDVENDAEFDIY